MKNIGVCNAVAFSICYSSTRISNNCIDAFTTPFAKQRVTSTLCSNRNSPGFVGFSGDDNPIRAYGSSNSRQSTNDFLSPQVSARDRAPNRVVDRQSNLSAYHRPSVNNIDPRFVNTELDRYSQRPHPSRMVAPNLREQQSSWQGMDGRIQGGTRYTYDNYGSSQTFVETDGRPLDVMMELWDGPNNTPTRVKMYSEDGRQRPMNILTNSMNGRGGTVSVRNAGPMEFPVNAAVSSMNRGYGGPEMMMGGPMSEMMMQPGGMRQSSNGFIAPSTARGETVQGGALKTFTLPRSVNAVQVTITSDGLPVNAKVELWGTSSHIKQLAEVYNDNGQTRPFAAIIDVTGGENTIAIRNTGPLEYPIKVVVEPVGMEMGDYMSMDPDYDMMDSVWDGPPPLPGMMMDGPPMLPPPW
ncbi:hypothetical protein ACHAWO_007665 [Cyclotella atomus]|uniref:Uncharacterized protein n=1 Tax=Cyclotella atomus TaxID=382360 RepID=A0ABD3Q4D7_9STRA